MRKTILLLALLLPVGASGLRAQTEYYARVGAVGASNLLRDVIVDQITVRQSIAPMLALGASLPIANRGYRAGLEGRSRRASSTARRPGATPLWAPFGPRR